METVSCRYFFEGRCTGTPELELLRGSICKNAIKDTCCYLCKNEIKKTCEMRCDFLEVREPKDTTTQPLSIEGVKVGYDILLRVYRIFGITLLVVGFIFLVAFMLEGNYLKALEVQWKLYTLTEDPKRFIDFLYMVNPFYLIPLGVLLVSYSMVKWRNP